MEDMINKVFDSCAEAMKENDAPFLAEIDVDIRVGGEPYDVKGILTFDIETDFNKTGLKSIIVLPRKLSFIQDWDESNAQKEIDVSNANIEYLDGKSISPVSANINLDKPEDTYLSFTFWNPNY